MAVRHEEHLTDREILSLIPGLVFAGHETTANLLGNGIAHLLGTPGLWRHLCQGDSTVADLVEEALRFDGPVIGLPRIVAEECELNGVQFHPGDRLYVCFWAANRDEGRFADAGEFNPARQGQPHVGFGRGIHFCIGAPLARLEAAIALRTLSAGCQACGWPQTRPPRRTCRTSSCTASTTSGCSGRGGGGRHRPPRPPEPLNPPPRGAPATRSES